jgi:hypothetical protein
MFEMVQRYTFMRDGEVWCFTKSFSTANELPVAEIAGTSRWPTFYIHPKTGILCEAAIKRRYRWARPVLTNQKWITPSLLLRKLNGLWFECAVMRFPKRPAKGDSPWRFDFAERREICRSQADNIYQRRVYCVSKRQLSRKELKQFGLKNSLAPLVSPNQENRRAHQNLDRAVLVSPASFAFDGPKSIGYLHHKEGVPSPAQVGAVRVRFPARIASDRSRHLSINIWMGRCALVIDLGSSTAFRASRQARRCGFDSRPEKIEAVPCPSSILTGR